MRLSFLLSLLSGLVAFAAAPAAQETRPPDQPVTIREQVPLAPLKPLEPQREPRIIRLERSGMVGGQAGVIRVQPVYVPYTGSYYSFGGPLAATMEVIIQRPDGNETISVEVGPAFVQRGQTDIQCYVGGEPAGTVPKFGYDTDGPIYYELPISYRDAMPDTRLSVRVIAIGDTIASGTLALPPNVGTWTSQVGGIYGCVRGAFPNPYDVCRCYRNTSLRPIAARFGFNILRQRLVSVPPFLAGGSFEPDSVRRGGEGVLRFDPINRDGNPLDLSASDSVTVELASDSLGTLYFGGIAAGTRVDDLTVGDVAAGLVRFVAADAESAGGAVEATITVTRQGETSVDAARVIVVPDELLVTVDPGLIQAGGQARVRVEGRGFRGESVALGPEMRIGFSLSSDAFGALYQDADEPGEEGAPVFGEITLESIESRPVWFRANGEGTRDTTVTITVNSAFYEGEGDVQIESAPLRVTAFPSVLAAGDTSLVTARLFGRMDEGFDPNFDVVFELSDSNAGYLARAYETADGIRLDGAGPSLTLPYAAVDDAFDPGGVHGVVVWVNASPNVPVARTEKGAAADVQRTDGLVSFPAVISAYRADDAEVAGEADVTAYPYKLAIVFDEEAVRHTGAVRLSVVDDIAQGAPFYPFPDSEEIILEVVGGGDLGGITRAISQASSPAQTYDYGALRPEVGGRPLIKADGVRPRTPGTTGDKIFLRARSASNSLIQAVDSIQVVAEFALRVEVAPDTIGWRQSADITVQAIHPTDGYTIDIDPETPLDLSMSIDGEAYADFFGAGQSGDEITVVPYGKVRSASVGISAVGERLVFPPETGEPLPPREISIFVQPTDETLGDGGEGTVVLTGEDDAEFCPPQRYLQGYLSDSGDLQPYAGDNLGGSSLTIGNDGCLMTTFAMAMSTVGYDMDPGEFNVFMDNNDFYTTDGLVAHGTMGTATADSSLGLIVGSMIGKQTNRDSSIVIDREILARHLDAGGSASVEVRNKNGGQHWVFVYKRVGDEYQIHDPSDPRGEKTTLSEYAAKVHQASDWEIYRILPFTPVRAPATCPTTLP